MGVESELKLRLVDAGAWKKLLHTLTTEQLRKHQENYYFETADGRLRACRATFRLRFENTVCIMTLKQRVHRTDGYFEAEEEEATIPAGEGRACITEPERILRRSEKPVLLLTRLIEGSALRCQGGCTNERVVYRWRNFTVELDHTTYPSGRSDYEVEVETTDLQRLKDCLLPFLEQHDIGFAYQDKTKYQRFLEDIGALPDTPPLV